MCPTLKIFELSTMQAQYLQHTSTCTAQMYLQMHTVYHTEKDQEPTKAGKTETEAKMEYHSEDSFCACS